MTYTNATTLVEFLRARLAEDERIAREAIEQREQEIARGVYRPGHEPGPEPDVLAVWDDWTGGPGIRMGPERLLADVEAKRRLIDLAEEATSLDMTVDGDRRVGIRDTDTEPYVGDLMLMVLALPYADHPDYDPSWRPAEVTA